MRRRMTRVAAALVLLLVGGVALSGPSAAATIQSGVVTYTKTATQWQQTNFGAMGGNALPWQLSEVYYSGAIGGRPAVELTLFNTQAQASGSQSYFAISQVSARCVNGSGVVENTAHYEGMSTSGQGFGGANYKVRVSANNCTSGYTIQALSLTVTIGATNYRKTWDNMVGPVNHVCAVPQDPPLPECIPPKAVSRPADKVDTFDKWIDDPREKVVDKAPREDPSTGCGPTAASIADFWECMLVPKRGPDPEVVYREFDKAGYADLAGGLNDFGDNPMVGACGVLYDVPVTALGEHHLRLSTCETPWTQAGPLRTLMGGAFMVGTGVFILWMLGRAFGVKTFIAGATRGSLE